MPYYNGYQRRRYPRKYRRYNWRPYRPKRWIRPRYRRLRKTIRKRRHRWVRKNKRIFKRKRKTLPLQQWQPDLIRNAKIKGLFTMFSANFDTMSNNYIQYKDSWVPQYFPSGGGWGIFVFNLGALFTEFLRLRNWWTVSNVSLPLCRYIKCKLTMYRDEKVDYVVHYSRNYPMTDNEYEHADSCPQRMLMRHRKIIVSSLKRKHRKPYIRKTIRPPKLLCNKWFFQRDLVNTNLLMVTATPCSLDNYSAPPYSLSNTIYFKTLNPKVFQNLNYHRTNTTEPYRPKAGYYLWATHQEIDITSENWQQSVTVFSLTFLGHAENMRLGTPINDSNKATYAQKEEYWGNVFCKEYLQKDYTLLVSNVQPGALPLTTATSTTKLSDTQYKTKFQVMSEPIYETIAYNPEIDTGKDNIVYFLPNFSNNPNWDPPKNDQLTFSGFPLWMLLWGWADWQKKLALISQIDEHYIMIIQSPYFNPNVKIVMPIDEEFLEAYPVYYDPHPDEHESQLKPLLTDQLSWHPKFKYQKKSVNLICSSGPGTYKFAVNERISAHLHYVFYFKWGGSPSTMETIANPEKQPKYPVPCNLATGLQIEDPRTDPSYLIYNFDIRRDTLTKKAAARLTTTTELDELIPFFTENQFNPPAPQKTEKDLLQTLLEKYTKEEEKKKQLDLFQQLKQQQQLIHNKLQHLIMSNIKL
nr:MAG: ORF1 [TTV-like mini virus]